MNKENLKKLSYKFLPIILVALNALAIVLFAFGFASIFYEKVNLITIFSHLGNLSTKHAFSTGEISSLFILSVAFIGVFVALIALTVRSALLLRSCILTQTIDFKLEYIIKIKNILVLNLLLTAAYVALAGFLSSMEICATAIILFILGIIALTAVKFAVRFFSTNDEFSDVIKYTAKTLVVNVALFVLGLVVVIPAFEMIIEGYRHISFLLPSDEHFKAFYSKNLLFGVLGPVLCVILFVAMLVFFLLFNRNELTEGPKYRKFVKSGFVVFLILAIVTLLITIFCGISCSSTLHYTFGQTINVLRHYLIPALLTNAGLTVVFFMDFKEILDKE